MSKRLALVVPVILAGCVVAGSLIIKSGRAEAENACLGAPNATAPEGSHWYYRVDRTTGRRCWYLAAKGARVRQTISRVPLPSRRPAARAIGAAASSTALPAEPPAGTTSSTNDVVTLFSRHWPWPRVPEAVDVAKRTPEPASNSYAEEDAAAENAQDNMPLVWPVHSAAELAATETSSASAIKAGHVVILLLGAFGLAGLIASAAFAFSLTRRQERHLPDTAALVARLRPQLSDASMQHRQVGIARKPAPVARTPEPTREPREPRTPRQEFEASLQELLGARRAPAA